MTNERFDASPVVDPRKVVDESNSIRGDLGQLTKRVDALAVIVTDDQAAEAGTLLVTIRNLKKKTDDARDALVRPLNEHVKKINALFKPSIDACDVVLTKLRGALAKFTDAKERAAKAEQDRLDQLARDRQADADRLAQEARDKAARGDRIGAQIAKGQAEEAQTDAGAASVQSATAAPVKLSSTAGGTVAAAKVWKHEVVDVSIVPRAYLMVDTNKIRDAVRAGVRDISGVRIFQETQIR